MLETTPSVVSCGFLIAREDFRGLLVADVHWQRTCGPVRHLRVTSLEWYSMDCSHQGSKFQLSHGHIASAIRARWDLGQHPQNVQLPLEWDLISPVLWARQDQLSLKSEAGPGTNRLSMKVEQPLSDPLRWCIHKHLQSLDSSPGGGVAQKGDSTNRPRHIPSAPLAFALVPSDLTISVGGKSRKKETVLVSLQLHWKCLRKCWIWESMWKLLDWATHFKIKWTHFGL